MTMPFHGRGHRMAFWTALAALALALAAMVAAAGPPTASPDPGTTTTVVAP